MKTNPKSPFFVVTLLAVALSVQCFVQIRVFKQSSENLKREIARAEKEIATIKVDHEKLSKEIEKRRILVMQAEEEMRRFTNVMKGLHDLARGGDKDALELLGPPHWEPTPRDPNDHRIRI